MSYKVYESMENYLTGEEHVKYEGVEIGEFETEQEAKDFMKEQLKTKADEYRYDKDYYIKYEDYYVNELTVNDSFCGFIWYGYYIRRN